MAAVLYYGVDDRLPLILNNFFASRKQDVGEIHSLSPVSEVKKFEELIAASISDLIIIEQTILDRNPVEWLTSFRKKFPAIKCPIILTGDEHDPTKILKLIDGGYVDYIVNPPDKPLIIEKFVIYSTGKRSSELRQVYSMKLNEASDLAKPGVLEELSEFDCKIRSGHSIPINEMTILYASSFAGGGPEKGAILGRCYATAEHDGFKGQFVNSFFFVGVTPDILVHIRESLQKAYVAGKSK